jgi:diguanylate cyclase (GGDEF)-like protein
MKLQTDLLKQEEIVFEQLFQTSNDGLLIISKKNKVLFINNFLEHILDGKNVIDDQGNINLENEKDDVYTFENEETKFYFDISYESIIYRSVDSLIYFFKDVTKPYLETHHLEKMALLDELTGLSNRRKLINDTAKTCDDQFSFAMLDIDYFKEVNDQYGHDRGDDILKLLSKVFTKRLRSNDDIYRFGGDEFIVLLRGTKVEKAKEILEELNTTFSNEAIDKYGIKVTFTAGIISIDEGGKSCDVHEYIKQVDKVLYRGKEKGRNRIEIEG